MDAGAAALSPLMRLDLENDACLRVWGRDHGRGSANGSLKSRCPTARGGCGSREAWAAGPSGLPDPTADALYVG